MQNNTMQGLRKGNSNRSKQHTFRIEKKQKKHKKKKKSGGGGGGSEKIHFFNPKIYIIFTNFPDLWGVSRTLGGGLGGGLAGGG